MAKYDKYGVRKPEVVYLAKPGQRAYCALNGVDPSTVNLRRQLTNTHELTLQVDKFVNGRMSNGYTLIDVHMLLFVEDTWFKITKPPIEENDGTRVYKEVTAESMEIELQQYRLVGFKVNRGSVDSVEMMYQKENNLEEFQQVHFCDKDTPGLSLMHVILDYADIPGWTIGYVDDITLSEESDVLGQKYFLSDEVASFDVDSQDVYSFLTQDVAKAFSCIFIFNTIDKTINAYRKDSLGLDTNIILGWRNLQNALTIDSESQVYTVFNVRGEDDLNIDYVNFGTSLIENFSYFMDERFLPKELIAKYNAWHEYMESRRSEYMELSKQYNIHLETIHDLMYRLPTDGTSNDWSSMDEDDLKTALDDYNALLAGLEKLYVDDEGNFDYNALKNSVDWALYEQILNYILPAVKAALQKKGFSIEEFGRGNLFQNVNPVITANWTSLDGKTLTPVGIPDEEKPCKAVTRGIQHPGNGGFKQKVSGLSAGETYTFSGYVRCSGNGTANLECNLIGQDRSVLHTASVTTDWVRISSTFVAQLNYYEFSYTFASGTYTVAGMQIEHGTLHDFGFYSVLANETDTLDAFETDWKLYGTVELKNKQEVYTNNIETLKKDGFDAPYSEGSGFSWDWHSKMHQKYRDYQKLYNECTAALTDRTNELSTMETERDKINEDRQSVAKDVQKDQFGKVQTEYEGFTEHELSLLRIISVQSDYVNENILTTSISTENEVVDTQYQLYLDAKKQLYVESRPQYTYSDSIDDLYALPQFRAFHDDLKVGNFLHVEISDSYFVKLRVIALEYNPCTWDGGVTVEFSNMTQYEGKRSDFTNLIDNAISSAVGQIVGANYSSDVTTYTFTPEAIKALLKNPIFNGFIDGVTSNTGNVGDITATTVTADAVITALLKADEAEIKNLAAEIIKATSITADIGKINDLLAGNVAAGSGQFINLTVDNVKIANAVIKDLIAARISVADLLAGTITLTDEMKIVSENGKMVMDGKVLQMLGTDSKGNEYVGIQLGYDTTENPSLILRNEEGSIIMSPSGITQDGIADGLIHTNHIGLGQVTPDRLSYKVELDSEGNQITNITRIYDGSGNNFGVDYTEFKESVNGNFNKVEDDIAALQNMAGTITLSGQQVFMEQNNTVTPDSITITATCKQGIVPDKWYINDTENTSYVAADKLSITIPSSFMADKLTATVKAINTEKNVYDVFTLYKIRHGKDGNEGKTNYIHIMYSDYPEPTDVSQMTTNASDYIGIYWDFYPLNSQNPADYDWMRFKGEEGQSIKGDPGEDGRSSYLHVRYSNDGGKTFTGNNGKDAGDWIGTYTDYVKEDSETPAMYTWLKAKGDQGIPGENGYTVILSNEVQVINTTEDFVPMSPTTYECSVTIYCGLDLLTPVMTAPKEGEFCVSLPAAPKGMQLKQTTAGTVIFTTGSSAINADGTIDLDIEVYGLEGHLRKSISYSASPRGQQGERGEGGLSVVLGNEFEGIMCDSTGKVLYDSEIDIPFYGYSGAKRVGCIAKTVQLGNGFTLLSNTASTSNIAGNIKLGVTAGVVLSEVSGVINCTFSIEATEVTKAFTWMQQTPGAEGQAARIYILETDALIIKKSDGNVFTPSSISFSGYYRDGMDTERHVYPGRFKIEEYAASAWTEKYLSSADESAKTWTPSTENVEFIKCSLCDPSGNILDMQTVTVIIEAPDVSGDLTEIKETISNISSTVDKQAMEIKDKISLTEMINVKDAEGNIASSSTLNDILVESKTSLDGFSNTVSNLKTEIGDKNNPADGTLYSAVTEAKQLANKFSWIVKEGSSESSMELTPNFAKIVSNRITFDGVVEVLNTGVDAGVTRINGGVIETNSLDASTIKTDTLNALLVTANAIKSATYEDSTDTKSPYSKAGMWVQLDGTGAIKSRNFAIDKDGNAYFKGEIHALTGELGSLTVSGTLTGGIIEGSKVQSTSYVAGSGGSYNKTSTGMIVDLDKGYIATPYMYTDSNGKLHATGGDFEGNVTTSYINAYGGKIGGFNIDSSSLWSVTSSLNSTSDGVYVGTDGINLGGGYFKVTSSGYLTAKWGTIGGFNLTSNSIWYGNSSLGKAGGIYLGASGFSISDKLIYDNSELSITGNITATDITAYEKYSIYFSSIGQSTPIIYAKNWSSDSRDVIYGFLSGGSTSSYYGDYISISNYTNRPGEGLIIIESGEIQLSANVTVGGRELSAPTIKCGNITNYNDVSVSWDGHTHSQYATTSDLSKYATTSQLSSYSLKTHEHKYLKNSDSGWGVVFTNGDNFKPCNASQGDNDNKSACGTAGSKWTTVYAKNGVSTTSDKNEKTLITDIDERYEKMFMELHPVNYMWKKLYSHENPDRVHCGLIAQEVNETAGKYGLSAETFATICRDDLENSLPDGRTERWGLRYHKLHGLEIHMIQKSFKEIEMLKAQNEELKQQVLNLLERK